MGRVVLCGYYGMGNAGDEALLAALLGMLPATATPIVLSANPKATEALHGVEARDRYSVPTLLRTLREADTFVWGGGSLMQDATSARNPIYYGGLLGLARALGCRAIAWAQGVGPLQRPLSRWIARQAFRHCERVSTRDRASAELLLSWGIPSLLAPDPVWALPAAPCPPMQALPAPRIAVALRSHPLLTPSRLAAIARALAQLQEATGAHVVFLPFQPERDTALAAELHAAMPDRSTILPIADPRQLKGAFRKAHLAIAMRLHALIAALAEGCPCAAIAYDPKVSHVMAETDVPGWELAALPADAEVLLRAWLERYVEGKALGADRLASLRDRATAHAQLLADV